MISKFCLGIYFVFKSARMLRESAAVDLGFRLEYTFHSDWRMHNMKAKWDTSKREFLIEFGYIIDCDEADSSSLVNTHSSTGLVELFFTYNGKTSNEYFD